MSPAALKSHTYKDLAQLAKKHGVPGWHSMRKDQLVSALSKSAKKTKPRTSRAPVAKATAKTIKPTLIKAGVTSQVVKASAGKPQTGKISAKPGTRPSPVVRQQIMQLRSKLDAAKNLARGGPQQDLKDRLVVMVRDPYWLHCYWELTRQSVLRVQAAMGQRWHTAHPVLRLFEVTSNGDSNSSGTLVRTISIHGGVNNWYIDVQDPPKAYRLDIGYVASDGAFFSITRSNAVTTPPAASRDVVDRNWADVAENFDRIYAMSGGYSPEGTCHELRELLEERLRRPMGAPVVTRYGAGGPLVPGADFHFDADAELIIFGSTRPDAHVMLKGEPVQVRSDGTFTVRLNLPDGRQVIPVVASSSDGVEQRTIALAIERNTKQMETVTHDSLG